MSRNSLATVGLIPPRKIIADGKWHRCAANTRNGKKDGSYKLFADGIPFGLISNFQAGISAERWTINLGRDLTKTERRDLEKKRAAAEAEQELEYAEKAAEAQAIWEAAKPCPASHSYLRRKRIKPHGFRVHADGRLLVPVLIDGAISSLQYIDGEADKKFHTGARASGGSYTIAGAGKIIVRTGPATGATIAEATGSAVVIAFGDGNLLAVAHAVKPANRGKKIIIAGDDDWKTAGNPGRTKATAAARAIGADLAVPDFGGLKRGDKDTDLNDLHRLAGLNAVRECIDGAVDPDEKPFPRLPKEALCGLAGDIVRTIEPHTESDPAAILARFLTGYGNLIGGSAYYRVEATRHHANLFSLIVGESSKARKGTARNRVFELLEAVDLSWLDRIRGGLSSGEAVVNEVRDEVKKWNAKQQTHEVIDPGITDKRLMISESEYGGLLSVMARTGNVLSPRLREAWDGIVLAITTKNSPLKATNAHVPVTGDITVSELRDKLTSTESANGFANRFLFFCAKRSKELPFGGNLAQILVEVKPVRGMDDELFKQTADEISRSGWDGEALIVSYFLPRVHCDQLGPGWLGESRLLFGNDGRRHGEMSARWWEGACFQETDTQSPWVGFCHSFGSYHDRITGHYAGGSTGVDGSTEDKILALWAEAANETQWRRRA